MNGLNETGAVLLKLWHQNPSIVASMFINVLLLVCLICQRLHIMLLRRRIRLLRSGPQPSPAAKLKVACTHAVNRLKRAGGKVRAWWERMLRRLRQAAGSVVNNLPFRKQHAG